MKKRLQVPLFTLVLTLFCLGSSSEGWGQNTWQYDFGTTTASYTTSSASTSFLPGTPVNGGTYRVRVGTGGGGFALVNPGTSLGSGSELQITAATSTSANKFGVFDWNSPSETAYVKFAFRTTSSTTGNLVFSLGNNLTPNDNQSYTGSYNNSLAMFWLNYNAGALNTVNRRGLGSNTSISSSGFAKDTNHVVEVFGNNSATVFVYDREGVGYTLAAQSWDLWVDGVKISPTNGWPRPNTPGLAVGNLTGFAFFAESSTSNSAMMILDDLEYANGLTPFVSAEPTLLPSVTAIDNLFYAENSGPSPSQLFTVSGSGLDPASGNVNVAASTNYEVSLNNTTFFDDVNIAYTGGEFNDEEIYIRLKTGLTPGAYPGNINITGGDADPVSVTLSGTVYESFDIPYFNGLRNSDDWNAAISQDFLFNGTSFLTTSSGYIQIPLNANIVSAPIDFSQYNLIVTSFDLTTFGGNTDQQLTVLVSDNNGVNYTALNTFSVPGSYQTFTQYIDVSALVGSQGRIKFEMTAGTNQIRFRDLSINSFDYFYDNAWVPQTPVGNSTATDNIIVLEGTAPLSGNTLANNITILSGATLNVESVLTASGNIINDGSLVFKSTSVTNTAQLDTFTGSITGSGEVTVERFIPARRAFRLLSSSVNTSGNIRANWQEGQNNTGTNFPDDNFDTNPGFGTHITGSTTGLDGFDATPSGNPSLFTLNNTTQAWEAVNNTNGNTITAGTAYRLFVRGDRSINVTDNAATPTNTTLRTTGALHTGPLTVSNLSTVVNEFNFFGNPYPAIVDMNAVLAPATNTNVNPNSFYIWDPTMNTRGAYVTVDLDPLSPSSDQYLQPGQAAFVRTLADGGASLTFLESHKAVTQTLIQVFSVVSKIDLRLFTASAFAQNERAADGLRIKLNEQYTNDITPLDAVKFLNLDENLATDNNGSLLSIESRALPLAGESIPLFTNTYRTTDYVFEAALTEINDITALLVDNFTGITTQLENNENTLYAFSINPDNSESIATDRFEIVFEELLSTNEVSFGNGFVLYPNPTNGSFNIATRHIQGDIVNLKVSNITGQKVYSNTMTVSSNGQLVIELPELAAGLYLVELVHPQGGLFTSKLIKK